MQPMIFVNLPIRDLAASRAFYGGIGFSFNDRFSDARTACVVISETIFVMLLTHERFADFSDQTIADSRETVSHLLALTQDSRDAVDGITTAALASGGRETRVAQDMGFMYSRAFADPDGHVWEPFWMDPAAVEPA